VRAALDPSSLYFLVLLQMRTRGPGPQRGSQARSASGRRRPRDCWGLPSPLASCSRWCRWPGCRRTFRRLGDEHNGDGAKLLGFGEGLLHDQFPLSLLQLQRTASSGSMRRQNLRIEWRRKGTSGFPRRFRLYSFCIPQPFVPPSESSKQAKATRQVARPSVSKRRWERLLHFSTVRPSPLFSKQVSTTLGNQGGPTDGCKLSSSNNRRRDAGKSSGKSVSGLPAVRLIASQAALCAKRLQLDGVRCLRAVLH